MKKIPDKSRATANRVCYLLLALFLVEVLFSQILFANGVFFSHVSNITSLVNRSQHENDRKSDEFRESPNVESRVTLSQASEGIGSEEGATTIRVSPNNNPLHERPTRKGRDSLSLWDNHKNHSLNGYEITKLNISPIDAWFTSNTANVRASNRYHEWETDSLAAAAENIVIEGDEGTASAITAPSRTGNWCQILRKIFRITDTQEAVNKVGRGSEVDYQTTKNLKELARDIEYALIINTGTASGATGTARRMNGVDGWITTNVETGSATGNQALTETLINDNLQVVWAAGGMPQHVLCGGKQKRVISAFSTNTRNVAASEKALTSAIDIYRSDFGDLQVRLHHQINTTLSASAPDRIFILGDLMLWQKAWLRPSRREELARSGASRIFMIEAELTLESRQEAGSGKITELTI